MKTVDAITKELNSKIQDLEVQRQQMIARNEDTDFIDKHIKEMQEFMAEQLAELQSLNGNKGNTKRSMSDRDGGNALLLTNGNNDNDDSTVDQPSTKRSRKRFFAIRPFSGSS